MNPVESSDLQIGRPFEYKLLTAKSNVGVYGIYPADPKQNFAIIAQILNPKNWERCQPTSAIASFETPEKAIETLSRWASDPAPPAMPKPPRTLNPRRNGNRLRQRADAGGQMFLNL